MLGNVKWFSAERGYGFILQPDGNDLFVHYSAIESKGFRFLESGQPVEYEVVLAE
ncbi:MAG: cold shock domain-containing protein [Negativicutes bacterium]